MAQPPRQQVVEGRAEVLALRRQSVPDLATAGFTVGLDDPGSLEVTQSLREHLRSDADESLPKVREPSRLPTQITDDKEGPAVADHLQRLGQHAEMPVRAGLAWGPARCGHPVKVSQS